MNLSQNSQVKTFFYLLMALAFFAIFILFRPYLGVIFFSLIIVITFAPVHRRVEQRFGRFRAWATPVTIIVVLLTILIPLTILLLLAINEVLWIIEDIIEFEVISDSNIDQLINDFNSFITQLGVPSTYLLSRERITEFIQTNIGSFATVVQGYLSGIGGNATALITKAIIFFSLLSTLFPSLNWLIGYLKELSPLSDDLDQIYIDRVIGMSKDMFRGIVVIALVQGISTGILFFILGIPYVILWTILATLLALIPIGTAFIFLPTALIFLLFGYFIDAAVVIVVGMLIIGNLDAVLRPRLVTQEEPVDSTLILIGALGGLALFGLLGVVYGPVLVIIFLTTLEIYQAYYSPTATGSLDPVIAAKQDKINSGAPSDDIDDKDTIQNQDSGVNRK
ncbi:MAG: AI-2E family transporter [Chloroflexota bacterium]